MPTVIDASALAAVLYDEPEAPAVLAGCEAELIAPGLLPFEMASICRTKMLRRPGEAQRLLDCHRSWSQVRLRLMEPDWETLPQLAQRWALSVYDAAYLQIALREGAALLTLDARLAAAADAAAADAAAADAAPVPGRPPIL